MTAFSNRLREAIVVSEPAQEKTYEAAVAAVASAKVTAKEQAQRLHLAFGFEAADDAVMGQVRTQFAEHDVEIGPTDEQLARVLISCVLIERFSQLPGRRARNSLVPDTVAALGARVLARAGRTPLHPDVLLWAEYWLESAAQIVRTPGAATNPPSAVFTPPGVKADGSEPTAAESAASLATQLSEFATQTSAWMVKSDLNGVGQLREEVGLLWWLGSEHERLRPAGTAVTAAHELAAITALVPGPPNALQLLRRRVGVVAPATVTSAQLIDRLAMHPPVEGFEHLFPLLSGTVVGPSLEFAVETAALWVLDELQLRTLLKESA